MSSPDNISKRERQKQRRNAKLQQQAALDAKARRNRILTFALLGVILLGLVGIAVFRNQQAAAERERRIAEARERQDELGCTDIEDMEDMGTGHLDAQTLSASPPDTLYEDRPASSGQHFGNWLKTGVYDELMDERALIHNMEHGYIIGYYGENAPEEQVAEFKAEAQTHIDGSFPKIIVAPWDGELPDEAQFAYVAWANRQMCAEFDADTFLNFIEAHHSGEGDAPPAEKTIPAHLEEGGGTIDPGDEPFLLPPLGTQAAPSEGMSDPAATEASEASS